MEDNKNNPKAPWWQPSLLLFTRLSGWIAGPVILAVFVGKWLDRKYNTEPWLFLILVGIAFFLSSFGIIHDSLKEMKRIEKEEKEKKDGENNKR
ncbi:MAG TPA: AtpZ/AtpI family protein [Candidatus Moranbacteria bacterium]|nr:AtpZ/AtpI family protein [Candidatus Moranbacteria bacterium]